ncbi:hypothetical protein [Pelagicoccus sp. SDUM812002]|uniref:hypothetical protein n=1 Tax=Pelagicoccus sp. SDUM812002 TaxID=3041266 RepID=UPI00280EB5DF|nr:hypothetical protein [Pelagicoccus sp. SDUM812002]MDQ8184105.1 hypothetical protein [Pelagicoccus sp. SDUM812002]
MTDKSDSRLVILTGPSCAGKSPLASAIKQYRPQLAKSLAPLVLYNFRSPRPGEKDGRDYHFRSKHEIEELGENDRYLTFDVRGNLQAVDVEETQELFEVGNAFFEVNTFVAQALMHDRRLKTHQSVSIFLSPLSNDEIEEIKDSGTALEKVVTDLMRQKLIRRQRKKKVDLALPDLEDIERRAGNALEEL